MDKKTLRNQIRKKLSEMSMKDYKEKSLTIKNKLLQEPSIKNAQTIAITISRLKEVDTKPMIEAFWELGKKVVVPKCNPENHSMDFYIIMNFDQLETVYLDLMEPKPEMTSFIQPDEIDVMIVPGVVFDLKGFRIGYGGGYYDRYLKTYNGTLLSIAFQSQIVDVVPVEPHDIPVHMIITEEKRIVCK